MIGWLRRGAAAFSLAVDRPDLWPAGALAWLAYVGWLPLILAVAPPEPDDLQFLGVSLVTSGAYPANVIALAGAVVSGALLLALVAAVAEVALQQSARGVEPAGDEPSPTLRALGIILAAAIPVVGALALLGLGIADRAEAAFTAPDRSSVYLRLVEGLAPQLLVLLLSLLLAQATGGAALHRALARSARPGEGLRASLRAFVRRPAAPLATAAAGLAKDALLLVLSYALLRVLWAPIGAELSSGLIGSPTVVALLVGFVAIWLVLLGMAGTLHVALSAWWMLELSAEGRRAPPDRRADAMVGAQGGDGR